MPDTKRKIKISSVIAALSFIYLALCPYVLNPIYNILLGQPLASIFRNFFSVIFNFGNALNFIACLVIAIGIFTKFDKIAITITSALFWLSSLISLISLFANAIKMGYFAHVMTSAFSQMSYMFAYFLMFAVSLWLTILFFAKKETPKFLKVLVFIPVAVLAIIMLITTITSFIALVTNLISGLSSNFLLYSLFSTLIGIFNKLVLLIGFTAVTVKLANFKKKPKNTVEISKDVVIENVVTEQLKRRLKRRFFIPLFFEVPLFPSGKPLLVKCRFRLIPPFGFCPA